MKQKIYSVSELNSEIKSTIEDRFSFVWITGELSNFKRAASGHLYFTLKDDRSMIHGVIFRGQALRIPFALKDGQTITGLGRLSLYEPKGSYQIIFEHLEKTGIGDLMIAFEALKEKLSKEGLFDRDKKKPIPFLPRCIGVATSPSGSVIRDIVKVAQRRFPNIAIEIAPCLVQGAEAAETIVSAIDLLHRSKSVEVIIVARGGGTFEDMAPFNSERVARAVHASRLPVISAIGHETDFTILDGVADLRAPTPSSAAELATPLKSELQGTIEARLESMRKALALMIRQKKEILEGLKDRMVHPAIRIQNARLSADSFLERLENQIKVRRTQYQDQMKWWRERLFSFSLKKGIEEKRKQLNDLSYILNHNMIRLIDEKKERYTSQREKLIALDPNGILKRGYSIVLNEETKGVVSRSDQTSLGDKLNLLLYKGSLTVTVDGKDIASKDGFNQGGLCPQPLKGLK